MHSHVLPGVDDGSDSLLTSLTMLKTAIESGVTDMILTPHYVPGRAHRKETLFSQFEKLNEAKDRQGLPIDLYLGNEVFCHEGMENDLKDGKILTMNGTNRVLVEFFPGAAGATIRNAVMTLSASGFVPILAHVERYEYVVSHADEIGILKSTGALIQVNAGTFLGHMGPAAKRFAERAVEEELVDFIGSDAHDVGRRTTRVSEAVQLLYRKFDPEYVRAITYDNTRSLLGKS
ncbi:MAG: histidinol-phosphatase [Lachnospiraceae bacterium]|nr:histidinol-phosphatase [Lachnospiraceae bacterium]